MGTTKGAQFVPKVTRIRISDYCKVQQLLRTSVLSNDRIFFGLDKEEWKHEGASFTEMWQTVYDGLETNVHISLPFTTYGKALNAVKNLMKVITSQWR
jgi:hypothetical protein